MTRLRQNRSGLLTNDYSTPVPQTYAQPVVQSSIPVQAEAPSSIPSGNSGQMVLDATNQSGIIQGPEGKALSTGANIALGLKALGTGTAATAGGSSIAGIGASTAGVGGSVAGSTAAGAGLAGTTAGGTGVAAGIGSVAAPVLLGALAVQQGSKYIAGEKDEDGLYKSRTKAGFGAIGNPFDTAATGKEIQSNAAKYEYFSGENRADIEKAGRLSRIPVFGSIKGSMMQQDIREKALEGQKEMNEFIERSQKDLKYENTQDYAKSVYGTTFAEGGNLGNSKGYFKAGGQLHENGGVKLGQNEIEKDEVVFDGYVFSNRLPYNK